MTLSDIQNKIYFLTKTNVSSFSNADMLIAINVAYNRVASLILKADDRWQWDDNNQTDLPIATANLVSSQQDYSISVNFLTVDRVEIKDSGGNWKNLRQIDQQDLKQNKNMALGAYLPNGGTPIEYDAIGTSVFLYPYPNYNSTAGLQVYFTRGPVEFTSGQLTAGTAVPGFNSLFHELIPLWVAYDFSIMAARKSASGFLAAIQMKEKDLFQFYGLRDRDTRHRLTVSSNGVQGAQSGYVWRSGADSAK